MKLLHRSALTSVISLLLGLLITAPLAMESASADTTITKTIVVRGADGNLLPNALVAIGYNDDADPLGWHWTNAVTTNSSGQAVISGLPVTKYSELYIQPAVDDVSNGLAQATSRLASPYGVFKLDTSSTFNIRLLAANLRLNLKYSNGNPVPIHTGIFWPSDNTQNYWYSPNTLREGAFGINIDSSLNCSNNGGNWQIQYSTWALPTVGDVVDNAIKMTASGCSPTRTLELKDVATNVSYPKSGDTWQISSRPVLFNYSFVSPLNQATILEYGHLDICPQDQHGNANNCFGAPAQGGIGLPDGTYLIRANAGDTGFSSTQYTAIISNNGSSYSLKVDYPASATDVPFINGRAIFTAGVPNLSGSITKPNGETITLVDNQGFDVQLLKDNGGGDYRYVSSNWSQGVYGFSISQTGNYKIEVRPYGLSQYVTTRSPVITVTNSDGIKLQWNGQGAAASSLSRNIALSVPNVVLNVLNPNTQESMTAGWVTVERLNSSDQRFEGSWYGNLDINPQYPGVAAGMFADGKYLLTVNPPQGNQAIAGLAAKQYVLVVSGSGATQVLHKGNLSTGEIIAAGSDGRFTITTGAANVVGRFLDSAGQGVGSNNNSWVNACLQRLMNDGLNWDWMSCSQTTSTGGFSISATDPGTYRVSLEPQGRSDIATTILGQFVLTSENIATYKKDYGNVTAASPTLKIRIREVDGTTNIKNSGIEIRKDNQFINWANTAQAGVVAINLAKAGVYQFIVNPTSLTPNSTRKLYTVTATAGDGGAITASIDGATRDANGITTLYLGAAQIRGRVLMPTGDTGVANAWVVAVDKTTNQELWQYGSNSSQDGSFAMSLPAGSYTIFARTPNGDITIGNSDPIGDVAITSEGAVTISGIAQTAGLTAATFTIRMQNPYWSGKVLPPTGENGISNARVCLNAVVNGSQFWSCANTDSQGRWAMGKPSGFSDFGTNDQLQVAENQNPQYSMATYTGKAAIEGAGFNHSGATVNLRLPAPNFSVTVIYGPNSTPASNLWVNVNAINGGWIGGSSTDANGVARFRVSDLTKGVQVQVDPSNNSEVSAVAAATTKRYQDEQMAEFVSVPALTFADTITLVAPNIRGLITDPVTSAKVANSWVELFDSSGMWLGGSNTNSNGYFALNAPSNATYRLNVNPPWGGSTTSTNHSYEVIVNGSGVITTFTDKTNNRAVETSTVGASSAYSLTLGTPSVIGKVIDPTNANVQYSWVVPTTSSNMQLWQLGSNSRADGSFSMAVPDGSYKIQANVPWNTSTYSSSAGCSVTIANGAVTTAAGGCVQSDRKLVLTLRAPNFTVIVRDSSGNPLQNAHVGLGVGSWNTNAQTDANGLASLFVDPAAINSANNSKLSGAQNIWMWIDPPYGNSTVVRSQCYSGQVGTACATLAQVTPGDGSFSNPQIVTNLPAPNTSVYVKLPNGSAAGANAWVSIMAIIKDGSGQVIGRNWIAGSNTDSSGKATFNLSDTSVAFAIDIEAPWNQRDLYSGNSFDSSTAGLTFADVNGQNFRLRTPNLTINAKVSDGSSAISGGWISVEEVNVSNIPTRWVSGNGLDQNGKVSLTLAADKRYRVTVNPAPGVDGVQTPCILTTNGSAVVSAVTGGPTCALSGTILTVQLATGNVVGKVTGPGSSNVVGAIVSANIHGSVDTSTLQVTSTDKNGNYNLQLEIGQIWDITVTPVNTPSDPIRLQSNSASNQTLVSGVNTINIALTAAA